MSKKNKTSSMMPIWATGGLFLGLGLGALMDMALVMIVVGVLAGIGIGYFQDKKNLQKKSHGKRR